MMHYELWILSYLNLGYPTPRLSEHQMTVLLEYYSIGVCSIKVNDCSIRAFGQSPVYKSMGFSYLNKFTYLNTFLRS